jgi:hypothetical protein
MMMMMMMQNKQKEGERSGATAMVNLPMRYVSKRFQ